MIMRRGESVSLLDGQYMEQLEEARRAGASIVMTNGCFDILHVGHIRYLSRARELGDFLLVAVNDDASVRRLKGAKRPINDLQSRMEVLSALRSVNRVAAFSADTPEKLICRVQPDILVKGAIIAPKRSPVQIVSPGRVAKC